MKPILSFMMTIKGKTLLEEERELLARFNPMGISLFGRNIEDKIQLKNLIDDVKNVVNRDDFLIAVDQEGGRVRRLTEPSWRPYAPQGYLNDESALYHTQLIASDLKEVGINMNYAPVLDIRFPETANVLKSRCFSDDEKTVARLGKIMVDEYIKNGICPCIKHMPGHGRVINDPHLELPVLNYSLKELEKDFYPFKELKDTPVGMTAHVVIPEVDDKPITQSVKGIRDIIRGEIGFKGLLISDALDMKALKGSFADKARVSLEAGCDAVCYYSPEPKDTYDIAQNSKPVELGKIEEIIKKSLQKFDYEDIAEKYYKIVGDISDYKEDYDNTEILKKMR